VPDGQITANFRGVLVEEWAFEIVKAGKCRGSLPQNPKLVARKDCDATADPADKNPEAQIRGKATRAAPPTRAQWPIAAAALHRAMTERRIEGIRRISVQRRGETNRSQTQCL
jgi:hypothetical protein